MNEAAQQIHQQQPAKTPKPKSRGNGAPPEQLELFKSVLGIYLSTDEVGNEDLYETLVKQGAIDRDELKRQEPIGESGKMYSPLKRQLRWQQQTFKALGLLERIPSRRGAWRATAKAKADLTPAPPKVTMLGFSTKLGLALWSSCNDVFDKLEEPIVLCLTSPPYCLAKPRAYGNPPVSEYVDFICRSLEPIVKNLVRGGTVALNISNDVFEPGSPARSLYRERLVIALYDRLHLYKMDMLCWHNPSKPPSPVQWASKERMQLNVSYEPIYILCNDPRASLADNRRVLQAHTERHLNLIRNGGEQRERTFSDGAYRLKVGSFGSETAGRIPRNVLTFGHRCSDQIKMRKAAAEVGIPPHGAPMPLALAKFLVEYLSRPGDLVVDPFGGSMTTGKAAEELGRRWIATELMLEHIEAGQLRFDTLN